MREIKKAGHLDPQVYDKVYPTSDATPRFYATPKIHKNPLKMRPIVSGINSITYHLARHLADLLKPLVGQSTAHIKNSKDLVTKISEITLEDGEVLTSFDVTALFTSVPGEEVVQMATKRAKDDPTWNTRTLLTPKEFGELLFLVVSTTYFQYNDVIYEQTYGMAMGSPLCPVLANLFMEEFERKALNTAPHRPKFWGRYVDDTGVVNQREYEQELFEHINSQHDSIQFTMEREKDNRLPMLDVMMIRNPDNTITTDVFRKETHTDHYLQWSSNHPVQQKLGIVRTLIHRASTLIKDPALKLAEKEKVKDALRQCGYPE